mmetsp:Transcript_16225/g.40042  ORF Transcript_16225/g.40042 Transcript_16225/m.40042 type:complete len:206 (+) Transcript_16225:258-875(+)
MSPFGLNDGSNSLNASAKRQRSSRPKTAASPCAARAQLMVTTRGFRRRCCCGQRACLRPRTLGFIIIHDDLDRIQQCVLAGPLCLKRNEIEIECETSVNLSDREQPTRRHVFSASAVRRASGHRRIPHDAFTASLLLSPSLSRRRPAAPHPFCRPACPLYLLRRPIRPVLRRTAARRSRCHQLRPRRPAPLAARRCSSTAGPSPP